METVADLPAFGNCSSCGFTHYGRPTQCRRYRQVLNEAAERVRDRRRDLRRAVPMLKARSDTLFLSGQLLGGPIMAVNTTFKIGLVIGLAGAIFPVIRRYSNWSTPGTVIVGSVFALIAAIWFVETPLTEEEALAAELARGADGQALSDLELGVPILIRD